MSTESVKQFWDKAQKDHALQAGVHAIQAQGQQATIAAIVKLAAEHGFHFTAADYETALKEELARQHAAGELDEQHLDVVAGGGSGSGGSAMSHPTVPTIRS